MMNCEIRVSLLLGEKVDFAKQKTDEGEMFYQYHFFGECGTCNALCLGEGMQSRTARKCHFVFAENFSCGNVISSCYFSSLMLYWR